MKIGINSGVVSNYFDEFECMKVIKEAGFDCVDYGYYLYAKKDGSYEQKEYKEHAAALKEYLEEINLEVYQMHAPMTKKIGIDPEEDYRFDMTVRCFEVAKILGCRYVVIHPRKYQEAATYDEIVKQREYNIEYFRQLGTYAHEYGVKIAIENLYRYHDFTHCSVETTLKSPNEIGEFIDALGEDFAACVDTGHAFINGYQPGVYLGHLKEKVKVIHISDNYANEDHHLLPYAGAVNWDDFGKELSKIGFDGVISLEIDGLHFPKEKEFLELKKEELKFCCKTMRAFADKYNLQGAKEGFDVGGG